MLLVVEHVKQNRNYSQYINVKRKPPPDEYTKHYYNVSDKQRRKRKIKNVFHPRKIQCSPRTYMHNGKTFEGTADLYRSHTIAFREIERKQLVLVFSRRSLKQRTDFGPCEQRPKDTVTGP